MNEPKVLVAVPYHPVKDYCMKVMHDSLKDLTYKNKEVIIRYDPNEYGSENAVKKQREWFRKYALANGFDYVYFHGCDTIPPKDVIETLLKDEHDISGGVYWGRDHADNGNVENAVAWVHKVNEQERKAIFTNMDNGTIVVDGMGMDCVLLSRAVLEKVSWMDWLVKDDDYPFYDRAKENGLACHLNLKVQCKHYSDAHTYSYLANKFIE